MVYKMKSRGINSIGLIVVLVVVFLLGFYREYRNELYKELNFYEKLAYGYDVNILLVGDSISEGAGASSDATRWPIMLEKKLEEDYGVEVLVNNVSMGGNTSYAGYVRTRELQDGDIYDLAIVCFAENDPEEDFELYYEILLRSITQQCPKADIITILESSQREYTSKIQTIQALAEKYEAAVADTIQAFAEAGLPYETLAADGIHPSDEGHAIYLEVLHHLMQERIGQMQTRDAFMPWLAERLAGSQGDTSAHSDDASTQSDDVSMQSDDVPTQNDAVSTQSDDASKDVNPLVLQFDSYCYLEKSDFILEGTKYTYYCKEPMKGILGLDYTYIDGEGSIQILADGMEMNQFAVNWNVGFPQRHIWVVNPEFEVENKIEVIFSQEEQMDAFQGMILSGS